MNRKKLLSVLMGGKKVDPQTTGLTMTVTTAGAATLTITGMTVAAGATVVADWGDGGTDTYSAGAGARTHAYAGAGTWTVKLTPRSSITSLNLADAQITGLVINAANPLPNALTYLRLFDLDGINYNINSSPLPSTLATIFLYSCSGITATNLVLPASMVSFTLVLNPGIGFIPVTEWTRNTLQLIRYENGLNSSQVDAILAAIWGNKANYTYATPVLDLLGEANAGPNGIFQAASPPTTGAEYKYDLINGAYTSAGPEWTVTTG
jgi:hypothetical protein